MFLGLVDSLGCDRVNSCNPFSLLLTFEFLSFFMAVRRFSTGIFRGLFSNLNGNIAMTTFEGTP